MKMNGHSQICQMEFSVFGLHHFFFLVGFEKREKVLVKVITCLLTMTMEAELFFFAFIGKWQAGATLIDVPKTIATSAEFET